MGQTDTKLERNAKIERLTADEVASLTTPAQAKTPDERRARAPGGHR